MNKKTPVYATAEEIESCKGVIVEASAEPSQCSVFTYPDRKFIVCTHLNVVFNVGHDTRAEMVCYHPERSKRSKETITFNAHKIVRKFERIDDEV